SASTLVGVSSAASMSMRSGARSRTIHVQTPCAWSLAMAPSKSNSVGLCTMTASISPRNGRPAAGRDDAPLGAAESVGDWDNCNRRRDLDECPVYRALVNKDFPVVTGL